MSAPAAAPRSDLRAVALPTEHGGWGLASEPALLGLLLVPSAAGAALAAATVLAFVARTPLKAVLVERHRHRRSERGHLARQVLEVEAAVLVALVTIATVAGDPAFWLALAAAAPFALAALWFDQRSRSRRLAPELAGAVAVSASAAAVVLAGGGELALAVGAWCIVAGRAATSIPHVRGQIARLHGRPAPPAATLAGDAAALVAAAAAVALEPSLAAGAVALVAVVAVQRALATRPLPRVAVLGVRQLGLGLAVVVATAVGAR